MPKSYTNDDASKAFDDARQFYTSMEQWLNSPQSHEISHSALEECLFRDGLELMRRLFQAHLNLRALREQRLERVADSSGVSRPHAEASERGLMTIFGSIRVPRLAYRAKGQRNLHPADAVLNLPQELHSHGIRRRVADLASKNSFGETVDQVAKSTNGHVAKRQAEALVVRAAKDFDAFYTSGLKAVPDEEPPETMLVSLSAKMT